MELYLQYNKLYSEYIKTMTMKYNIRARYFEIKDIKERRKIRQAVCKDLNIKTQSFYDRIAEEYEDLNGSELLVWQRAFNLNSINDLLPAAPLSIA